LKKKGTALNNGIEGPVLAKAPQQSWYSSYREINQVLF
jgi:hypothetical protein